MSLSHVCSIKHDSPAEFLVGSGVRSEKCWIVSINNSTNTLAAGASETQTDTTDILLNESPDSLFKTTITWWSWVWLNPVNPDLPRGCSRCSLLAGYPGCRTVWLEMTSISIYFFSDGYSKCSGVTAYIIHTGVHSSYYTNKIYFMCWKSPSPPVASYF